MVQICIKSIIKALLIIYKYYKFFIQNNLITPISLILRQVAQASTNLFPSPRRYTNHRQNGISGKLLNTSTNFLDPEEPEESY